MLDRLSPARRNIALAALFVLVAWFAWTVRAALNPLLLGLLFAYILHPLVLKLERRGWSRKRAVNVIFGAVAASAILLTLGVFWQARTLVRDLSEPGGAIDRLQEQVTTLSARTEDLLGEWGLDPASLRGPPKDGEVAPSGEQAGPTLVDEVFARAKAWITSESGRADAAEAGLRAAGGAWVVLERIFGSLIVVLTLVFLVPLYTWFLLFELERITSFVSGYIPRTHRQQWTRIGEQMAEMLGAFFRGRLIVCFLKGALLSLTMFVLGVPYSLLVGLVSGFLSLIPVVGPGVGYLLTFLIALLKYDPGEAALYTGIVFAIGEVGEGYVLMPKVLGERLGLPPVVVIASLMICGSALGMFGLLLALPLTAAIVILTRELVLPALKAFAEGGGAKPSS